ncbi:MAG: helicase-related protein, partial [Acidimicrobiia bacterium]|nr:helicase-related protein [Acidimicrobiia bacterium]
EATVGLLTGDNVINPDALVVVMTTEVLRNMIYAGSPLDDLAWVVLDEVHYLQDAYRGPVWEEVIIHAPPHVGLVCLSATVSNAAELADWISLVRGPTDVVVETERPVRLEHLFLASDRSSERVQLVPVLVDGQANPEGHRFDGDGRPGRRGRDERAGRRARPRFATPRRVEVIDELTDRELVPAIVFVFSRAGCDEAVRGALQAGIRLTGPDERARIRAIAEHHVRHLSDADLDVLGHASWLAGLEAGVAAHHAGMVPPFKEAVEACFVEGLVKVVYATETLALGINMPARTVVIERLTKFNGEGHSMLTPGEYTQLTGRAGRRGIDPVGHAVVLWSPFTRFEEVASLASSRTFFLRSAFRPTYNMAANLVQRHGREGTVELLNRSFAQYQADRSIVRLQRRIEDRRAEIERVESELGVPAAQLAEYRALRSAVLAAGVPDAGEQRAIETAVGRLTPGTVLRLGRRRGEAAVVLAVGQRRNGSVRVRALTEAGRVVSVSADDFDQLPDRLGTVELPRPFDPYDRGFQREVGRRLRRELEAVARSQPAFRREPPAGDEPARTGERRGPRRGRPPTVRPDSRARRQEELRAQLAAHPLAGHPQLDRLMRTSVRLARVEREVGELTKRIDSATDSVARRFDRLLALLRDRGYVEDWTLTERGQLLARCYHECDLLVVDCLAEGLFDDLGPAELAALASVFSYEHRSRTAPPQSWLPSERSRQRFTTIQAIARGLVADEERARITPTREPDATFAALAYAWCSGGSLDDVLADEDLTGGDFVRNVKQLIDLCRQLGELAPSPATARAARQAADLLFRGVVSASSIVGLDGADDAPGAEDRTSEAAGTRSGAGMDDG